METSIAAIALGATVIEKHITINNKMEGLYHLASMEIKNLKHFVRSLRNTEKLLGRKIKVPTRRELKIKKWVRKSIVAKISIKKRTQYFLMKILYAKDLRVDYLHLNGIK